MERETLEHLLGRIRTDLRLKCLRASRELEGLLDRCLSELEGLEIEELNPRSEDPGGHSSKHGACEGE